MSLEETNLPPAPGNYAYLILAVVLLVSVAVAAMVLFFWPKTPSAVESPQQGVLLPDGSYPTTEGTNTESGPRPM